MPVADAPPLFETSSLLVDGELLLIQRALRPAMNNPMLHAGLALAGANCSAPGRSAGFVTAAEVAALDLRGTELVVLSACDTGLGAIPPGGEFAGLRRAFAMAGAAAQVISLWEVDEDATTALMTSFYRHLLAGAGRAEALRRAQHEVRRRPRWAHPGAWAAFVAWGAWGPLSQRLRAASTEATT
jgi:CHAT domain-containing protein